MFWGVYNTSFTFWKKNMGCVAMIFCRVSGVRLSYIWRLVWGSGILGCDAVLFSRWAPTFCLIFRIVVVAHSSEAMVPECTAWHTGLLCEAQTSQYVVLLSVSLCCDCQAHVCFAYRYIRFIYNRVILENAPVRAAAVAAMAQFGATCPDLLPNIQVVQLLPSLMCDLLLSFIKRQQLKAQSNMTKLKKGMVWYCLCSVSQSTLCSLVKYEHKGTLSHFFFGLSEVLYCLWIVPFLFWGEFHCMSFLIMRSCLFAV